MTDRDTNRVFFSAQLTGTYKDVGTVRTDINNALREHGIDVEHDIRNTRDIWARDYMPIQVAPDRFMSYIYWPDYLRCYKKYRPTITVKPWLRFLEGKQVDTCPLVLDGGNVVVCGDKMILTEKVFRENKNRSEAEVTGLLERYSGKQVIWIPCDPYEEDEAEQHGGLPLCHADGVLHAIDDHTVLLGNYSEQDSRPPYYRYREQLEERLSPHFDIKELKFDGCDHDHCWIYINYLQVGDVVLMPTLARQPDEKDGETIGLDKDLDAQLEESDNQAEQKLCSLLHTDTIVRINSRKLTFNKENGGGSLHCVSWNVYDSAKG